MLDIRRFWNFIRDIGEKKRQIRATLPFLKIDIQHSGHLSTVPNLVLMGSGYGDLLHYSLPEWGLWLLCGLSDTIWRVILLSILYGS